MTAGSTAAGKLLVDEDRVNHYLEAAAVALGECYHVGLDCFIALTIGAVIWMLAAAWGKIRR